MTKQKQAKHEGLSDRLMSNWKTNKIPDNVFLDRDEKCRANSKQSKAFALKQLESGAPIAGADSKAANSAHKILEPYKATADHYIFSFLILSTNTYV